MMTLVSYPVMYLRVEYGNHFSRDCDGIVPPRTPCPGIYPCVVPHSPSVSSQKPVLTNNDPVVLCGDRVQFR